jgi:SPP1 family predicted phage head-tail adaptor
MRIGDLRRRIDLQSRGGTKDSFGQQSTAWANVLSGVPCELRALSGRELIAGAAINSEVTHELRVRYHSLLADPVKVSAMRAVYVNDGVTRYFNLSAPRIVDERNREIVIQAAEGVNPG